MLTPCLLFFSRREAAAPRVWPQAEDPCLQPPAPLDPDLSDLTAQYDSATRELEAQEQVRLLGVEDRHLALLKAELEALRADLQEDLESLGDDAPGAWSGLSTPAAGGSAYDCGASEEGDSAAPPEPRSPALGTPSPKRACSSSSFASELGYVPSAPASAATVSAPTSGAATPLSPRSPHRFDFDAGAEDDWLSTDGGEEEGLLAPRGARRALRPEIAVAPPLPPLALAPPAGGLEAALRAAFESDGMTEDEWDNEEEWLMPTARPVRPLPPISRAGSASLSPGGVRKQVKVPRLNLARAGAGASGGASGSGDGKSGASTPGAAKVTISARGGITGRPKTARGGQKAPGTSRLGGGAGGSPSPLKSARGATPAPLPTWNFSTKTIAALDSPPALFPRGGTTARRDAPTPRLVPASSASPRLRCSPSQLSRAGSDDSAEAKLSSRIPRLQLPAATREGA